MSTMDSDVHRLRRCDLSMKIFRTALAILARPTLFASITMADMIAHAKRITAVMASPVVDVSTCTVTLVC